MTQKSALTAERGVIDNSNGLDGLEPRALKDAKRSSLLAEPKDVKSG